MQLLHRKITTIGAVILQIERFIEDIENCTKSTNKEKEVALGTAILLLKFIDENNLFKEELMNIEQAYEIGQNSPVSLGYDAADYIEDTFKFYHEEN